MYVFGLLMEMVFHIGVGSDVVCSTLMGSDRASVRGTDNRRFHAFLCQQVNGMNWIPIAVDTIALVMTPCSIPLSANTQKVKGNCLIILYSLMK